MVDYRRAAAKDSDYGDIPDREKEEVRDEVENDDEEFEDAEELDDEEEEDDTDLGRSVLDQERGAAAARAFTAEIGSEGGSYGETEVEREPGRRRVNAGEATTTGGEPADDIRFDHRRDEER